MGIIRLGDKEIDVAQTLAELDRAGTLAHAPFLAGITPVRSARAARSMTAVPGIRIPQALIDRLERSSDPQEEGVQITLEIIERVRRLPGVRGVHIMAVGWELIVPRLVREVGYEPVLVGPLAMGKYLMPGTPLAGERSPEEIRRIVATLK